MKAPTFDQMQLLIIILCYIAGVLTFIAWKV
jgi:hypothetical protein